MAMVVRTNYSALNSTRNLNLNTGALDKNLEKLSSGYKVNKAADDAAGLAISEKMKAQITALDRASENAQDGISLIQSAEGYLNEIHTMLNRMVKLALQSANGISEPVKDTASAARSNPATGSINSAGTDRNALQQEMNQLCAEIDRIANTANFNNVKLFDGSLTKGAYQKLSGGDDDDATYANSFSGNEDKANGRVGYETTGIDHDDAGEGVGLKLQIGETSKQADKLVIYMNDMSTAALFDSIFEYSNGDKSLASADSSSVALIQNNQYADVKENGTGETVACYTINISSQDVASLASDALRSVINDVSMQRAQLGAMQNRLEYTINNLDTASENISAANSRIRDTDVAKEMSKYTRNNVLVQAASSMLAQANSRPQQALQLMG